MTEQIEISTDQERLDLALVHWFLARKSHWARGIDRATVERSVRNSLCFGAYRGGAQIGFARVVTDRATFAFVCDVFVLAEARGRGVAKVLVDAIMQHPDLQGLRRMALTSRDAKGLYERIGFTDLAAPERWMERHNPAVYGVAAS
jgi:GNAT superfamily N-acetyltransferase